MPEPALPEIPVWGQITAVVTFVGAAFGVIRQAWKSEGRKSEVSDTVVVSGAFADSKPIRQLVEAIERLDENSADRTRATVGAIDDMKREQVRMVEALNGVRDDIHRGVSVKIVPGA